MNRIAFFYFTFTSFSNSSMAFSSCWSLPVARSAGSFLTSNPGLVSLFSSHSPALFFALIGTAPQRVPSGSISQPAKLHVRIDPVERFTLCTGNIYFHDSASGALRYSRANRARSADDGREIAGWFFAVGARCRLDPGFDRADSPARKTGV